MIYLTLHNESQAQLEGLELNLVREHFSVENKAANFQRRLRSRFIKDRIYAITPKGKCDVGLVGEIIKYCKEKKIDFDINNELFKVLFPSLPKPTRDYKLKFELRDYQQEIVDKCINAGRGTIVLATAGGKTLTMAGLLEYYYQNVNKFFKGLIIVPDLGLVNHE